MAYCKLYINFAANFNNLIFNNMKRISIELKKNEDGVHIYLPLKEKSRTRKISIIISENLEYIGYKTFQLTN